MAEIRIAKREDIPQLIELGVEFATKSQFVHGFSVSRERIVEFTNDVVCNPATVVLVLIDDGVQGFLMGSIIRIFFSEDVALQEMAWYVRSGFGGMLLMGEFEQHAKAIGCKRIVVGNKPQYCDFKTFYERRGFTLLENQYIKTIGV